MKTTEQPVVVSKIFDKSIEDVWNAITVKEEMLKWFF